MGDSTTTTWLIIKLLKTHLLTDIKIPYRELLHTSWLKSHTQLTVNQLNQHQHQNNHQQSTFQEIKISFMMHLKHKYLNFILSLHPKLECITIMDDDNPKYY